jgi:hypothetical protein
VTLPELRRSDAGVTAKHLGPDLWRVIDVCTSRDHNLWVGRMLHDGDVASWATLRAVWPEPKLLARIDSTVVSPEKIGFELR